MIKLLNCFNVVNLIITYLFNIKTSVCLTKYDSILLIFIF